MAPLLGINEETCTGNPSLVSPKFSYFELKPI